MTFLRVLSTEGLKLRRTIALRMVFIAPIAVALLTLFMASQAPFSTLRRGAAAPDVWRALIRVNLQFWALLMLPLFVTLQAALIAGVDHSGNQWKALFARPIPRWSIYLSKLWILVAMTAASAVILAIAIVLEGRMLHAYDGALGFGAAPPIAALSRQVAQITALAFLLLSVQLWVSLRWRSFSVATGFGVLAIVTSFAMLLAAGQYGAWPQYFPWSLPMLVLARQPQNIEFAIGVGLVAGTVVTAGGCVDFCRRDVE